MDAVDKVVDALDQIVATGRLVGFAAGIHENGRTRIVTGVRPRLRGHRYSPTRYSPVFQQ